MHELYNLVWHADRSSNNTKPRAVHCFRGRACLKAVAGVFAFLAAPQAVADLYISQSGRSSVHMNGYLLCIKDKYC